MSWRRSGIMNSTPSHPPISASMKMREYSRSKPRKTSAGSVKMTPEAMDWPALPVVWTMLFSRIDDAAEGAQNADGEHRDGDGSGDREPGAQAHIDRDRAKDQAEEAAQQNGAERELRRLLVGGNKGLKLGRVPSATGREWSSYMGLPEGRV